MLQFANSFQCTYLADQDKIIIRIRQAVPNVDKNSGEQNPTEPILLNDVIDLVVDSSLAEKLSTAINELCHQAISLKSDN